MQLLFGRDNILNVKHVTNWEHIRQQKQARIYENNMRKNSHRIADEYALGKNIIIKLKEASKHEQESRGPYEITAVNDNGTIRFQKCKVNDVTNIHRIKLFIKWK